MKKVLYLNNKYIEAEGGAYQWSGNVIFDDTDGWIEGIVRYPKTKPEYFIAINHLEKYYNYLVFGACNPERGLELFLYDWQEGKFYIYHGVGIGNGKYLSTNSSFDVCGLLSFDGIECNIEMKDIHTKSIEEIEKETNFYISNFVSTSFGFVEESPSRDIAINFYSYASDMRTHLCREVNSGEQITDELIDYILVLCKRELEKDYTKETIDGINSTAQKRKVKRIENMASKVTRNDDELPFEI